MQKLIKVIIPIFAVAAGTMLFYCLLSAHLDRRIDELYLEKASVLDHLSGASDKDKGNVLLAKTLENSNMIIMGSSELSSPVPENPVNLFPNDIYEGDATFIGHAYVQNALHAMNLGANSELLAGKDIMIIDSLQWFMGEDIDRAGFLANFSELQFYEFLNNDGISDKNKEYLCNRYIQLEQSGFVDAHTALDLQLPAYSLPAGINNRLFATLNALGYRVYDGEIMYPQTYMLAKLYLLKGVSGRLCYHVLQPYYGLRFRFLELKDKYDSYKLLLRLQEDEGTASCRIDWDDIYAKAEQEGVSACTNNDLCVNDEYYNEYLRDSMDELKDSYADISLMDSKEWDDLAFFVNVCSDLGIRPYIVSMSVNGLYYDHIGMDKGRRKQLYDRIESIADANDLECFRTDNKEYEPFFYYDVMHLGWKGWPYVTQHVIEHFSK